MVFKINSKTRIKIIQNKIRELYENNKVPDQYFSQFKSYFQTKSGLKETSRRYSSTKRDYICYYQVIDINKYFLAKIQYGI
jgi:hypothetical protein